MITYNLRNKDELMEELRVLGLKKKVLDENYRIAMLDITADASVINSELELLKALGKNS